MFQDIRHGLRSLIRTPSFLVAALLTLALGIGSTAAIFSIAYAVLLKPLPYPDAHRLFVIASPEAADVNVRQTGEIFHYLRERIRSFENIAASGGTAGLNLSSGARAEHVSGMTVSRGYFDVIGVRPVIGRGFSVAEDQPGGPRVVILSDALSRRLFRDRADALGESIQLGGIAHTVVGVMPPTYWQTPAADLWTALRASPTGNAWNYSVIGRLREGASESQTGAELDAMRWTLQREVRDLSVERAGALRWVSYQYSLGRANRDQLVVLTGAGGFLLLIGCVNVASLQLVRGVSRRREMATRAALGGGRTRLIRQVLIESLLLAVGGAAFGLLTAGFGRPQVVGETIRLTGNDPPRQIVGVIADVKARSGAGWTSGLNALAAPAPPAMYVPVAQVEDSSLGSGFPMNWIARGLAADANLTQSVRVVVQASAPMLPFLRFEAMHEVIARDLEMQRFLMMLVGAFAAAAIALAVIGMYGLTAYAVSQRTQEVGIRLALGATAALVIRGFLTEGLSVALAGLVAGLVGAAFATRILSVMIFDVAPQDPMTLVLVGVALVTMAIIATLIPSLQAARMNPARVMRAE